MEHTILAAVVADRRAYNVARATGQSEHLHGAANKIISSPAYMLGKGIAEVNSGIEKTINTVLGMA